MNRDTRILHEKEMVYVFFQNTKRRYNHYLKHMEAVLTDDEEWKIVAGCCVEFFALLAAEYGQRFLPPEIGKENLQKLVGEMWDGLVKTNAMDDEEKTNAINNIIDLAMHKGTIN